MCQHYIKHFFFITDNRVAKLGCVLPSKFRQVSIILVGKARDLSIELGSIGCSTRMALSLHKNLD